MITTITAKAAHPVTSARLMMRSVRRRWGGTYTGSPLDMTVSAILRSDLDLRFRGDRPGLARKAGPHSQRQVEWAGLAGVEADRQAGRGLVRRRLDRRRGNPADVAGDHQLNAHRPLDPLAARHADGEGHGLPRFGPDRRLLQAHFQVAGLDHRHQLFVLVDRVEADLVPGP